mmetsp:Transcript_16521/g.40375  ORF Transcript_16521/g.40375 Transcript_16521/m.40375 type:complete len:270 (-) Transcript_16521:515-1324(-)
MRLRPLHRDELLDIAKRGSATAVAVLLFWGITAPALIFDKPEDFPRLCRYSALMTTIVVVGCFWSSYRNLLTPDLSESERKLGFVLFWSVGSYCGYIIWLAFFSEWHAALFAIARLPMRGLSWQELEPTSLFYYNSSLRELLKLMDTMDWLHLFGEALFMHLAWFKYLQEVRSELEFREALFWFCTKSIFQCYSFVQSISLSFRLDGMEGSWPEPGNSLDQCIVWSIRLFPILGSLICATFAYQLLFNKGEVQMRQQQQEETKRGAGGN